jgi:hypothetical protein
MATYTLISSNVLSSSAASVTFSSIPATYTDLVVRFSVRHDGALTASNMKLIINSDSGSSYSDTRLSGNGATATSARASTGDYAFAFTGFINGASSTSNTFTNGEFYLPSYTSSTKKPYSTYNAVENNATTGYNWVSAQLWQGTTTINDLYFDSGGYNFVTGSSFYLYGISNA